MKHSPLPLIYPSQSSLCIPPHRRQKSYPSQLGVYLETHFYITWSLFSCVVADNIANHKSKNYVVKNKFRKKVTSGRIQKPLPKISKARFRDINWTKRLPSWPIVWLGSRVQTTPIFLTSGPKTHKWKVSIFPSASQFSWIVLLICSAIISSKMAE